MLMWSSKTGDVNVSAIGDDGGVTISVANSNATATGVAVLTAEDLAALQTFIATTPGVLTAEATTAGLSLLEAADAAAIREIVAPSSTILSDAATTAIAALTSGSSAADIVAALQSTDA